MIKKILTLLNKISKIIVLILLAINAVLFIGVLMFSFYHQIKFWQEDNDVESVFSHCSNIFCSYDGMVEKFKTMAKNDNHDAEYYLYLLSIQNSPNVSKEEGDLYFSKCQKVHFECQKIYLSYNYNKKNIDANEIYIKYYSYLKTNKKHVLFVDMPMFPYSEYLKLNDIPMNKQVNCVVFEKCKEN